MTTPDAAHWQAMGRTADPLADRTVAVLVGPWTDTDGAVSGPGAARLAAATRLMATWTTNASLADWAPPPDADPEVAAILAAYLDEGRRLPEWVRPADIERAEALFMAYGPLSCTLLFCASLPECYVLPHLAEVLHAAGQLEAHTEHRIRQTAAMVFPVMMKGGLLQPDGCGVAQVLKVRLIHATIRHLILRGEPGTVHGEVGARPHPGPRASMHQALVAHGWSVARQGVPCSQTELAYTLLTFHYVFLRGLRQLHEPIPPEDETAFLHAWNVAGHVLGIRSELMPADMAEAERMFETIQALTLAQPARRDVRPGLGRALMDAMARSIRVPVLRSLPVPITRWLVGPATAAAIGADERVGLPARMLFATGLALTRGVDGLLRIVWPRFSLVRLFTRAVGYHLMSRFLLDQTRPLNLPQALLDPMHDTIAGWHQDPHAPRWAHHLEDRLTTVGPWKAVR
ncbi:oxygenase MpaB family protein [Ramlibacter sp.]|uniref:oxygenase MpaB family protein n=1 Tax=Ramlibacter sp. TaxID=1917967 RepID=UPI0035B19D6C